MFDLNPIEIAAKAPNLMLRCLVNYSIDIDFSPFLQHVAIMITSFSDQRNQLVCAVCQKYCVCEV